MINIAIDGPSGAGKSTVAKMLAGKMNIKYLDTGAMYRATALFALEKGIPVNDERAVRPILDELNIDIEYKDGTQRVLLCGKDVSTAIREHHVSKAASDISAIPAVRMKLVEMQRKIASESSCVLDGRDIGTYVLPDADLKIFLTASVEERARRRFAEMQQKGMECDIKKVEEDIKKRDENDSNREFAPLRQAEDAVLVDSSELSFDEVCQKLYDMINEII